METPIINYNKRGPLDEEDDKLLDWIYQTAQSNKTTNRPDNLKKFIDYLSFRIKQNKIHSDTVFWEEEKERRWRREEGIILSYYWPKDMPLHQLDLSKNLSESDKGYSLFATNKGRILMFFDIILGEYMFYEYLGPKRKYPILRFNPYGRNKDDSSEFIVKKIYL